MWGGISQGHAEGCHPTFVSGAASFAFTHLRIFRFVILGRLPGHGRSCAS
jgi:hypothetical protein